MSEGRPARGRSLPITHQSSLNLALVANFFLRLAGSATGLMLTLYIAYINRELYPVSAVELGLIAIGFYVMEMGAAPLLGAQSDRRGRRVLLVLGPVLGLIAVQLTALTTILPVLFVTRLLEGLSTASATPALLGYLSARTEHDAAFRGRVMSRFEFNTTLGLALGGVAGSLLWGGLGRPAFVLVGALYLLSALLFWRVRDADDLGPGPDPRRPPLHREILRVLRYRP